MTGTTKSHRAMATLVLGLVMAPATLAHAQHASVGTVRAELRTTITSAVPYILDLTAGTSATVVEQTPAYTVFELRVQASANARWSLGFVAGAGALDVRCETGEWLPVQLNAEAAPVVFLGAPTDRTEIVVRFRVRGTPAEVQLAKAQIVLRPVATAQGAVSVNWSGNE